MRRLFVAALCLLSTGMAHALVEKDVSQDKPITVKLSKTDPNVISIDSDRINRITSMKGVSSNEIDPRTGVLMIKPAHTANNTPFSAIVFTEKNRRYTLLVVPMDIPAQDVILKDSKQESEIPTTASYQDMITKVMRAMVVGGSDFKREPVKEQFVKFKEGKLSLNEIYHGENVHGEVMTFKSRGLVNLDEAYFYGANVLAVAITDDKSENNIPVTVFRVVKNG